MQRDLKTILEEGQQKALNEGFDHFALVSKECGYGPRQIISAVAAYFAKIPGTDAAVGHLEEAAKIFPDS